MRMRNFKIISFERAHFYAESNVIPSRAPARFQLLLFAENKSASEGEGNNRISFARCAKRLEIHFYEFYFWPASAVVLAAGAGERTNYRIRSEIGMIFRAAQLSRVGAGEILKPLTRINIFHSLCISSSIVIGCCV